MPALNAQSPLLVQRKTGIVRENGSTPASDPTTPPGVELQVSCVTSVAPKNEPDSFTGKDSTCF